MDCGSAVRPGCQLLAMNLIVMVTLPAAELGFDKRFWGVGRSSSLAFFATGMGCLLLHISIYWFVFLWRDFPYTTSLQTGQTEVTLSLTVLQTCSVSDRSPW